MLVRKSAELRAGGASAAAFISRETDSRHPCFRRQLPAALYTGLFADVLPAASYITDREGEATDNGAEPSGRSGGSDSAHDTASDADGPKKKKKTASGVAKRARKTVRRAAAATALAAQAAAAAQALQLRFVNGEDEPLARAVAENRGLPNKRSLNGIRWRVINRKVMAGRYGAVLKARVTSLSSKVLSKRWWLICPLDYPNRDRKIR